MTRHTSGNGYSYSYASPLTGGPSGGYYSPDEPDEVASSYALYRMETTQQYRDHMDQPESVRVFDYFAINEDDEDAKPTYVVTEWLYDNGTRELIDDGAFDIHWLSAVKATSRDNLLADEAVPHFRKHLATMTDGYARAEMIILDTELANKTRRPVILDQYTRQQIAVSADIVAHQAMFALVGGR